MQGCSAAVTGKGGRLEGFLWNCFPSAVKLIMFIHRLSLLRVWLALWPVLPTSNPFFYP